MNEVAAPTATARLLCVDDEPSILSALKRVFRTQGYTVLTATSGQEGLALMEKEPVDVVISDMRMPEMDGAQFLEKVFAGWPATKRILLTGHADAAATIAAINQGKIWRYVAKPWNDGELILTVQQALAHRNLLEENERLTKLTQRQNAELKELNTSLEGRVEERTRQLGLALKSLRHGFVNTVHAFSSILDLRGGHLAGHSRRVADHARKVARKLGLDEAAQQDLFLAGLLHDIGKLGLPNELIERPFNSLGPEKRADVMRHPAKGQTLLMPIEQLTSAALLVRHHHELFNGTGYPDGLSGMQIPLGARVLAAVNDYDSLQLGTLVARCLTSTEALRFLVDNRGKRYDPSVVDAFSLVLAEDAGPGEIVDIPLRPVSLQPGMRLTRDLLHRDGYLLLAKDQCLNAPEIAQLSRLESADRHPITVYVAKES